MPVTIYFDVDAVHINPTATLFPKLIARALPAAKHLVLGRDQVWEREVSRRDHAIAQLADVELEAIVLGPGIPFFALDPAALADHAAALASFSVMKMKHVDLVDFFEQVWAFIRSRSETPLFVSALNFDYYAATKDQIGRLADGNIYVIGPNHQFVRRLNDLPEYAAQERHMVQKRERLSDAWSDWLNENPNRVISALHYVDTSEFHWGTWEARRPRIEIPGVDYTSRTMARRGLEEAHLRVPKNRLAKAVRAGNRLGLKPFARNWTMSAYHRNYKRRLRLAKAAYVGPGVFGLPVRKYFEVPASGALMICTPCEGLDALGYVDGVNCLVSDPGSVASVLDRALQDASISEVAAKGQEHTWLAHRLDARAEQIATCVDAILNGSYRGSSWINGNFVVERG